MPSSDLVCTPVCPFRAFTCYKQALAYQRRRGELAAFCSWIGDACIGYKCQFAGCSRHALLPDGTCKMKLEAVTPAKAVDDDAIEKEAEALERQLYGRIRDKLKKLGTRAWEVE
jgi:hypothetical protein|uniref:Uncharacterized protein n=1 Tax=Thermofilum pendens TaxID=2269 RepID=A0A7C3WTV3_THEPE